MVVNSSINVDGTSNKTLNHLVRRSARSSQGMRFSDADESLPILEQRIEARQSLFYHGRRSRTKLLQRKTVAILLVHKIVLLVVEHRLVVQSARAFDPQHGQDLTAKQARIGPEQAKESKYHFRPIQEHACAHHLSSSLILSLILSERKGKR